MAAISIAILGPTCSGKTDVAIAVARRLPAEIISCDSMQVYRELTIGTAKPSLQQRARVRHHLVDVASIAERYDTSRFLEEAEVALNAIDKQHHIALLVGGTGLYAKALVYGYKLPPANEAVFAQAWQDAADPGRTADVIREIQQTLGDVPPAAATNPRRLARLLEIARVSSSPSENELTQTPQNRMYVQFILHPPRAEHRLRIRERCAAMLEAGWGNEAQQLAHAGLFATPTARQALGYREVAEFAAGALDVTHEELLDRLVAKTWQYARRQRTWFRHQHPGACHIVLRPGISAETIADAICDDVLRRYAQVIHRHCALTP